MAEKERILREIQEGRRSHEELQREGLKIQERAAGELVRIHDGLEAVRPTQVQVKATATALNKMTSELKGLYSAETRTTQAIEAYGTTTEEGLAQIHDDLADQAEADYEQNEQIIELEGQGVEQREEMIGHLGDISEGVDAISSKMTLAVAGIGAAVYELDEIRQGVESIGEELEAVNDNLGTLIDQGETAIEQHGLTNETLAEIVAQFMKANSEIVNFRKMTQWYFQHFLTVLQQHSTLLEGLTNQVIIAKLAVVAQVYHLQQGVTRALRTVGADLKNSIQQGNTLLQQIVQLTEGSLENEALQYFRSGRQCFATAENKEDLQDAYDAFCEGIKVLPSSVENHFGAGLSAEKLGNLNQAKTHYNKAGKRATKDQAELASKAYESKAKIEESEKDMLAAIKSIAKAVIRDPQNPSVRMTEIRYLIQGEKTEELEQKVAVIIAMNGEQMFLRISSDPLYKTLSGEKRKGVVEAVWKTGHITSPRVAVYILQEMIEVGSKAIKEPLEQILKLSPQMLLQCKIWLIPGFSKHTEVLQQSVRSFLENSQTYVQQHRDAVQELLKNITNT